MSLYLGTSSTEVVDLIANNGNEDLVKQLLKAHYLPPIGSVKLLARPSVPTISGISQTAGIYYRTDEVFIGWVVADGSMFASKDFADAFAVFGTKYGGTSSAFAVPNLKSFYKIDNTSVAQPTSEQPCRSMLLSHSHKISGKINSSLSGKIENSLSVMVTTYNSVPGTIGLPGIGKSLSKAVGSGYVFLSQVAESDGDYSNALPVLHHGSGDGRTFKSQLTINSSAKLLDSYTNYAGDDGECYPAHKTVIPMIYIGARV